MTLLNSNSSLRINSICLNKTRIGFYYLLKKQGAKIEFKNLLSPLHSINSAVKSAIEDSSIESGNIIEVITTMTIPSIFKRVKRFIYSSVYIKA